MNDDDLKWADRIAAKFGFSDSVRSEAYLALWRATQHPNCPPKGTDDYDRFTWAWVEKQIRTLLRKERRRQMTSFAGDVEAAPQRDRSGWLEERERLASHLSGDAQELFLTAFGEDECRPYTECGMDNLRMRRALRSMKRGLVDVIG